MRPAGIRARFARSALPALMALALGAQPPGAHARQAATPIPPADTVRADARADSLPADRWLAVTSEPSGARVYRDTTFLGTTPLFIRLGDGTGGPGGGAGRIVRLRIIGGDPGTWFLPVAADSVIVPGAPPGGGVDTLTRHYVLPVAARVTSDPSGADVLLGDSLLGRTPLFTSIPGPSGTLTLRKEGFQPRTILLGHGTPRFHTELVPDDPSAGPEPSPLAGVSGKSRTTLFIAAGTAVVTGAASAWLKIRADNYYEDYQNGGDPATLDRVRRFDLLSGIALSVAEISLGYLIIELLSR